MKKVLTGFITIILLFTITNVYADETYSILIDENNNFTLKDSSNNQVVDETIAKYENNTLTLGENTILIQKLNHPMVWLYLEQMKKVMDLKLLILF